MEQVVRVSWKSDVMPVSAFNYWHKECYTGSSFPHQEIREMSVQEVYGAVCCGCWQRIAMCSDDNKEA